MTFPHSSERRLAAMSLILWVAVPICCPGQAPSAMDGKLRALASLARIAEGKHDYASAARDYVEMLQLRELPEIRATLGLMDHLLGQYAQAVQNFKVALHEQPDLFIANFFLGLDLLHLHCPREALGYLLKADRLSGSNPQVKLALGRVHTVLGQVSRANENYNLAASIAPRNIDALYGLGITYMSLERSAIENLSRLKGVSARLYSRMLLGEAFATEGRFRDSARIYQNLITSAPKVSGLHAALGFDELSLGDLGQAQMEFNMELRTQAQSLPALLGLADDKLRKEKVNRAADILEEIWKMDPAFLQANFCRIFSAGNSVNPRSFNSQMTKISESTHDPALQRFLTSVDCNLGTVIPNVVNDIGRPGQRDDYPRTTGLGGSPRKAESLYEEGHYSACAEESIKIRGRRNATPSESVPSSGSPVRVSGRMPIIWAIETGVQFCTSS